MEKEIEIKISVDGTKEELIGKIFEEGLGVKEVSENYQTTHHLDTPNSDLANNKIFMRTREEIKDGKTCDTMTIKIKSRDNKKYFQRDEEEISVSDAKKLLSMLKILGFTKERILEKVRITPKKELECDVCLDITPIGNYLEIEGEPKEIEKMIQKLKLEDNKKYSTHYWELNRIVCGEKGIKETKDVVFKKDEG